MLEVRGLSPFRAPAENVEKSQVCFSLQPKQSPTNAVLIGIFWIIQRKKIHVVQKSPDVYLIDTSL